MLGFYVEECGRQGCHSSFRKVIINLSPPKDATLDSVMHCTNLIYRGTCPYLAVPRDKLVFSKLGYAFAYGMHTNHETKEVPHCFPDCKTSFTCDNLTLMGMNPFVTNASSKLKPIFLSLRKDCIPGCSICG